MWEQLYLWLVQLVSFLLSLIGISWPVQPAQPAEKRVRFEDEVTAS